MKKYFIWGMGLLGTSLGMDLRRLGYRVAGCVRSGSNLETLHKLGFDECCLASDEDEIIRQVRDSSGIILGTPVDKIPPILDFLEKANTEAWITDMASTKTELMLEVINRPKHPLFVGSHPMAGSDLSGPENGRENLFVNAIIYMTPAQEIENSFGEGRYQNVLTEIHEFWAMLGAKPHPVHYRDHDKWAAYLSHGLHLVACMVSHLLKDIPDVFSVPFNPAGGSFRDITRVAGSNPSLWNGIIGSNAEEVKNYLARLQHLTNDWHQKMNAGELPIEQIFAEAAEIREKLINKNTES